jgi:probable rRNA maturation factor
VEKVLSDIVATDVPLAVEFMRVDGEEIRELNASTRGVDAVTDVLSYPTLNLVAGEPIQGALHPYDMDEEGRLLLGSIVVCKERAEEQAEEYGHGIERELHYLLVHGVMHCLGYDHIVEEDKAKMREREEAVLTRLGITR